jgi:hydroxymethylglutaryl-CoA synthase
MKIGIEKINMNSGSLVLDVEELALARNKDPKYIKEQLMIHKKSQNVDFEDVITLAVNAAKAIISEKDKEDIEMCIFATESGLDYCKSNSTYVCRYLGLKANVRNFEIKNACYATTCAVQMAISWVASQVSPGKKVLVVSSDVDYAAVGRPTEEGPAVGAVAMLISDQPKIVAFELGKNGHYTFECTDYARPTSTIDVLSGEESVYAYLECVDGAWNHYRQKIGSNIDPRTYFKRMIYHTPVGGVVKIAHRNLLKTHDPSMKKKETEIDFKARVEKSFFMSKEVGHTYSSSIYMCLLSLLLEDQEVKEGDRLAFFSYGSGCCAEFFSAIILPEAREIIKGLKLHEYLQSRYKLTVEEFDYLAGKRMSVSDQPSFETQIDYPAGWYDKYYKGKGLLTFRGRENFIRKYEWS